MDPNALLARLRDLAADAVSGAASLNDVTELGEAVQDLDAWLSRAGALPRAWDYSAMRAAMSAAPARQHDDD
jgi:hypothetical protein